MIYLPRFTKSGDDRALKVHSSERDAGKRANYHVYYRQAGKVYFDPSWSATPQSAIENTAGMFKEVRMKAEVLGVVSLVPCEV